MKKVSHQEEEEREQGDAQVAHISAQVRDLKHHATLGREATLGLPFAQLRRWRLSLEMERAEDKQVVSTRGEERATLSAAR